MAKCKSKHSPVLGSNHLATSAIMVLLLALLFALSKAAPAPMSEETIQMTAEPELMGKLRSGLSVLGKFSVSFTLPGYFI